MKLGSGAFGEIGNPKSEKQKGIELYDES